MTGYTHPKGAKTAESQKLTLDVVGAVCGGCVGKLTAAFREGGLKVEGKLLVARENSQRVIADAVETLDLGAAAKKVNDANTPHKSQVAPGLSLVLFAKLDMDSSKKAEDALAKVKGVDKSRTKTSAEKGEIIAKIKGGERVTVADIQKALKDAGIETTLSKLDNKENPAK